MIFVDFLEKSQTMNNDKPEGAGAGAGFEMYRNLATMDEESEKLEPLCKKCKSCLKIASKSKIVFITSKDYLVFLKRCVLFSLSEYPHFKFQSFTAKLVSFVTFIYFIKLITHLTTTQVILLTAMELKDCPNNYFRFLFHTKSLSCFID